MLHWCKRGSFSFTPAQLVARQQVARNKQHVAGKLLVACNMLLVPRNMLRWWKRGISAHYTVYSQRRSARASEQQQQQRHDAVVNSDVTR